MGRATKEVIWFENPNPKTRAQTVQSLIEFDFQAAKEV